MDANVPYVLSVANLHRILDAIQKAGIPESFNLDFLKDLGFTSSNDRPVIKVLKYLGMLDSSGRPQQAYRDFVDHTKAKAVLAARYPFGVGHRGSAQRLSGPGFSLCNLMSSIRFSIPKSVNAWTPSSPTP
jgi:hypothetical protein